MLIGASNLWFPVTQSIIDMPLYDKAQEQQALSEEPVELLSGGNDWMLAEKSYESMRKTILHHPNASSEIKRAITDSAADWETLSQSAHAGEEVSEQEHQRRRPDLAGMVERQMRRLERHLYEPVSPYGDDEEARDSDTQ